ncbi:MAG TPA: T9SS type A sorting domain-containing protein, partial [Bacteroidetes bacterium]|nr:T9SS type A sorting domain-containing protein [Bacteroidota bacterium]
EKGINEVEIRLYEINGELKDRKYTSTDQKTGLDGYYSFYNVPKGKYYIQFINQIGYFFTQAGIGNIDSLNSDVISIIDIGATDTINIEEGVKVRNINAGFVLDNHSAIGDRVWEDLDGNGIQDDGEPGINGVLIQLYKKGKGIVGSVLTKKDDETGLDGYYLFDNLSSGDYYIKISIPGSYYLTKPDVRDNDKVDSDINDGNGYNTSGYFHLGVNERKYDVDVGAFRLGEVGDFVWLDDNENGIQEPGEKGLKFIFISVFDENGNNMGTMISNEFGNYRSKSLIPGKYYLKVLGYTAGSFTASKQGNEKFDSDITNEFGDATTSLFQILSGQFNNKIDIGILPQSQINLITYPNPVSNILQLSFNTMKNEDVKIIISNVKGDKVKEIDLISNIGTNIIDIDFSNYRAGYYSVLLETGNRIPERKVFLKVK